MSDHAATIPTEAAHAGTALAGGFGSPVFDAQSVFRNIMSALARPGSVVDLGVLSKPPQPLTGEAGAVALTLLDHETPIWCDQALSASPAVAEWLRFHTSARIVEAPSEAAFAFIAEPARMPPLSSFSPGTTEYPDRSTTLVVAVESLSGRDGANIEGPGIETRARIAPQPLPPAFWDQARANHALFPRGVDMLFVTAGQIAALPRSTRILKPEA